MPARTGKPGMIDWLLIVGVGVFVCMGGGVGWGGGGGVTLSTALANESLFVCVFQKWIGSFPECASAATEYATSLCCISLPQLLPRLSGGVRWMMVAAAPVPPQVMQGLAQAQAQVQVQVWAPSLAFPSSTS